MEDVDAALNEILHPGDNVVFAIKGSELDHVNAQVDRPSLIVLIRNYQQQYGLLACDVSNNNNPVVKTALPISESFKIHSDAPLINFDDEAKTTLNFAAENGKVMLVKVISNSSVDIFIGEVQKAINGGKGDVNTCDQWIRSYLDLVKENYPDKLQPYESNASLSTLDTVGSADDLLVDLTVGSDPVQESESESVSSKGQAYLHNSVLLKEKKIALMMQEYEDQYINYEKLRVRICTWNVNGQLSSEDLSDWLQAEESKADILAIGFQELDLSAEALLQIKDSSRMEEWIKLVEKYLPRTDFYRLKVVRLVGMLLLVYVRNYLRESITEVHADTAGTGIMGMMGNKGGVAVRFNIHLSGICLVNSHLAAHSDAKEKRNQDYKDICSKIFSRPTQPLSILDHETVFWFGDLNYRLVANDSTEAIVRKMIADNMLPQLFLIDQLHQEMKARKVFENFMEGPINFIPTYKYDPGTDNWDTSEKCRTPAWCDRVLWKAGNVLFHEYRSHPLLKSSDHKPVSANFTIFVRVINKEKHQQLLHEIVRQLDKRENDYLPQISLNQQEFSFGDVKYLDAYTKDLIITNTGKIPVQYTFMPRPGTTSFCKPWLQIKPSSGRIMIGKSLVVKLIVMVKNESAPKLNTGEEKLEDILILHLEGGQDHFISVSGSYLPSCFGVAIDTLVYIPGAIREIPLVDLLSQDQRTSSKKSNTAVTFEKIANPDKSITPVETPKELWLLQDYLHRFCLETEGIFTESALEAEMLKIRDAMDTINFPHYHKFHAVSVANCLLDFLDSFPEPVIPYEHFQKALDMCNNFQSCKQVLSQIPNSHRKTFKYICSFLREILKKADKNKLDVKTLATIFGEVILKPPQYKKKSMSVRALEQQKRKKSIFIAHFLTNDFDE